MIVPGFNWATVVLFDNDASPENRRRLALPGEGELNRSAAEGPVGDNNGSEIDTSLNTVYNGLQNPEICIQLHMLTLILNF